MDTDEKAYLDERRLLNEMGREAAKNLDTWLVNLSAGALAISLTFLKDVVKSPKEPGWLGMAWFLLTMTMLATMISSYCAQKASYLQLDILDADYVAKLQNLADHQSAENPWSSRTERAAQFAVGLFVVGVLALLWFSYVNLPR